MIAAATNDFVILCSSIKFVLSLFSFCSGWALILLSVDLGETLSVLISDLVRSLGSTEGRAPFRLSWLDGFMVGSSLICLGAPSFAVRLQLAVDAVCSNHIPLCRFSQGTPPFVGPLLPLDMTISERSFADPAQLLFYEPDHFRAGNIHTKGLVLENLLLHSPCSEVDLSRLSRDGVRVERF